jgi:hypothetical protein
MKGSKVRIALALSIYTYRNNTLIRGNKKPEKDVVGVVADIRLLKQVSQTNRSLVRDIVIKNTRSVAGLQHYDSLPLYWCTDYKLANLYRSRFILNQ